MDNCEMKTQMVGFNKIGNFLRVALTSLKCICAEFLWNIKGNNDDICDSSASGSQRKQIVRQIFEPSGVISAILP